MVTVSRLSLGLHHHPAVVDVSLNSRNFKSFFSPSYLYNNPSTHTKPEKQQHKCIRAWSCAWFGDESRSGFRFSFRYREEDVPGIPTLPHFPPSSLPPPLSTPLPHHLVFPEHLIKAVYRFHCDPSPLLCSINIVYCFCKAIMAKIPIMHASVSPCGRSTHTKSTP